MGQSSFSGIAAARGAAQTTGESRAARACSRAYRVHALLIACAGAVFFCGAQFAAGVQKGGKELRADTVTARRFELIGANGKKAALLCAGPHGGARMSFYDEKEVLRLGVGISDDAGPELMLYDRDGHPRLSVAFRTAIGAPTIMLLPDTTVGGLGLLLTTNEDGPSVALAGKKGDGRLSMSLDVDGLPSISLDGPGRKLGITLTADGDNQWIMLSQGDRRPVRLGMRPDGSPELQLSDRKSGVSSTMTIGPNGETTFQRLPP